MKGVSFGFILIFNASHAFISNITVNNTETAYVSAFGYFSNTTMLYL